MLAEALEHLVRGIVDHPDDVSVRTRQYGGRGGGRPGGSGRSQSRSPLLEVRVHPDDLGRVIGRQGRTATALRTVVSALGDGKDVRVDFVDVDRGR